jgi:diguanylate cyclase (GGDEF)-like protein
VAPGSAPAPASAKVLVADDSEVDRIAARDALCDGGYAVVEAADGQEALQVCAKEQPDLVMLDVVMPRLTGLETCRILKAKAQADYLPVIMVSKRNSANARVEGLRSGADDYLDKPFDPEELRARVEVLLRTRRMVRQRLTHDTQAPPRGASEADGEAKTGKGRKGGLVGFRLRMEEEFGRAERYSDPLACLRVEIDGYEGIAESHGAEPAGELVESMRRIIESSIRKIDLIDRIDENGYLLLLPNTHFPGALAVAERVSRDARRLRFEPEPDRRFTVSVGVSFYPNKDTETLEDLVALVQAALRRARGEGGGKICLFQHQGYMYAPEE